MRFMSDKEMLCRVRGDAFYRKRMPQAALMSTHREQAWLSRCGTPPNAFTMQHQK